MNQPEYTDEQRSSNRRSISILGAVLLLALALGAIFGVLNWAGFVLLGLGVVVLVPTLWWLFASSAAEPVRDPGKAGYQATMFTLFGFGPK